jgi:hypothetical protein
MNGYVMNPSWLYCTCCMPPLPVNGGFVRMCKRGALQFVFLKPLLAVITVVLFTQGKYTEGYWGANNGCVAPCAQAVHTQASCLMGNGLKEADQQRSTPGASRMEGSAQR